MTWLFTTSNISDGICKWSDQRFEMIKRVWLYLRLHAPRDQLNSKSPYRDDSSGGEGVVDRQWYDETVDDEAAVLDVGGISVRLVCGDDRSRRSVRQSTTSTSDTASCATTSRSLDCAVDWQPTSSRRPSQRYTVSLCSPWNSYMSNDSLWLEWQIWPATARVGYADVCTQWLAVHRQNPLTFSAVYATNFNPDRWAFPFIFIKK